MQFQKIPTDQNTSLILNVDDTDWESGIDITDQNIEYNLTSDMWHTKSSPPKLFIVDVEILGILDRKFIMAYTSEASNNAIDNAFHRSAKGKMYPKASAINNIESGTNISVQGYFGFSPANYNAYDDNDGDYISNIDDAFPLDFHEWRDTDGDRIGDNTDPDADNDGVPNTDDAFPLDFSEQLDTDGDGIGDNADADADNDGTPDTDDAFPLDPSEQLDTDGDGIGNNADPDDDNDGIPDINDEDPLIANINSVAGALGYYIFLLAPFLAFRLYSFLSYKNVRNGPVIR